MKNIFWTLLCSACCTSLDFHVNKRLFWEQEKSSISPVVSLENPFESLTSSFSSSHNGILYPFEELADSYQNSLKCTAASLKVRSASSSSISKLSGFLENLEKNIPFENTSNLASNMLIAVPLKESIMAVKKYADSPSSVSAVYEIFFVAKKACRNLGKLSAPNHPAKLLDKKFDLLSQEVTNVLKSVQNPRLLSLISTLRNFLSLLKIDQDLLICFEENSEMDLFFHPKSKNSLIMPQVSIDKKVLAECKETKKFSLSIYSFAPYAINTSLRRSYKTAYYFPPLEYSFSVDSTADTSFIVSNVIEHLESLYKVSLQQIPKLNSLKKYFVSVFSYLKNLEILFKQCKADNNCSVDLSIVAADIKFMRSSLAPFLAKFMKDQILLDSYGVNLKALAMSKCELDKTTFQLRIFEELASLSGSSKISPAVFLLHSFFVSLDSSLFSIQASIGTSEAAFSQKIFGYLAAEMKACSFETNSLPVINISAEIGKSLLTEKMLVQEHRASQKHKLLSSHEFELEKRVSVSAKSLLDICSAGELSDDLIFSLDSNDGILFDFSAIKILCRLFNDKKDVKSQVSWQDLLLLSSYLPNTFEHTIIPKFVSSIVVNFDNCESLLFFKDTAFPQLPVNSLRLKQFKSIISKLFSISKQSKIKLWQRADETVVLNEIENQQTSNANVEIDQINNNQKYFVAEESPAKKDQKEPESMKKSESSPEISKKVEVNSSAEMPKENDASISYQSGVVEDEIKTEIIAADNLLVLSDDSISPQSPLEQNSALVDEVDEIPKNNSDAASVTNEITSQSSSVSEQTPASNAELNKPSASIPESTSENLSNIQTQPIDLKQDVDAANDLPLSSSPKLLEKSSKSPFNFNYSLITEFDSEMLYQPTDDFLSNLYSESRIIPSSIIHKNIKEHDTSVEKSFNDKMKKKYNFIGEFSGRLLKLANNIKPSLLKASKKDLSSQAMKCLYYSMNRFYMASFVIKENLKATLIELVVDLRVLVDDLNCCDRKDDKKDLIFVENVLQNINVLEVFRSGQIEVAKQLAQFLIDLFKKIQLSKMEVLHLCDSAEFYSITFTNSLEDGRIIYPNVPKNITLSKEKSDIRNFKYNYDTLKTDYLKQSFPKPLLDYSKISSATAIDMMFYHVKSIITYLIEVLNSMAEKMAQEHFFVLLFNQVLYLKILKLLQHQGRATESEATIAIFQTLSKSIETMMIELDSVNVLNVSFRLLDNKRSLSRINEIYTALHLSSSTDAMSNPVGYHFIFQIYLMNLVLRSMPRPLLFKSEGVSLYTPSNLHQRPVTLDHFDISAEILNGVKSLMKTKSSKPYEPPKEIMSAPVSNFDALSLKPFCQQKFIDNSKVFYIILKDYFVVPISTMSLQAACRIFHADNFLYKDFEALASSLPGFKFSNLAQTHSYSIEVSYSYRERGELREVKEGFAFNTPSMYLEPIALDVKMAKNMFDSLGINQDTVVLSSDTYAENVEKSGNADFSWKNFAEKTYFLFKEPQVPVRRMNYFWMLRPTHASMFFSTLEEWNEFMSRSYNEGEYFGFPLMTLNILNKLAITQAVVDKLDHCLNELSFYIVSTKKEEYKEFYLLFKAKWTMFAAFLKTNGNQSHVIHNSMVDAKQLIEEINTRLLKIKNYKPFTFDELLAKSCDFDLQEKFQPHKMFVLQLLVELIRPFLHNDDKNIAISFSKAHISSNSDYHPIVLSTFPLYLESHPIFNVSNAFKKNGVSICAEIVKCMHRDFSLNLIHLMESRKLFLLEKSAQDTLYDWYSTLTAWNEIFSRSDISINSIMLSAKLFKFRALIDVMGVSMSSHHLVESLDNLIVSLFKTSPFTTLFKDIFLAIKMLILALPENPLLEMIANQAYCAAILRFFYQSLNEKMYNPPAVSASNLQDGLFISDSERLKMIASYSVEKSEESFQSVQFERMEASMAPSSGGTSLRSLFRLNNLDHSHYKISFLNQTVIDVDAKMIGALCRLFSTEKALYQDLLMISSHLPAHHSNVNDNSFHYIFRNAVDVSVNGKSQQVFFEFSFITPSLFFVVPQSIKVSFKKELESKFGITADSLVYEKQ